MSNQLDKSVFECVEVFCNLCLRGRIILLKAADAEPDCITFYQTDENLVFKDTALFCANNDSSERAGGLEEEPTVIGLKIYHFQVK